MWIYSEARFHAGLSSRWLRQDDLTLYLGTISICKHLSALLDLPRRGGQRPSPLLDLCPFRFGSARTGTLYPTVGTTAITASPTPQAAPDSAHQPAHGEHGALCADPA